MRQNMQRRRPKPALWDVPLWTVIAPGWPQWRGREFSRGLAFLLTFLSCALTAAVAWGTWVGWAMTGAGVWAHWASAAELVRRRSFPPCGIAASWFWAAAGLGGTIHGPTIAWLLISAWPTPQGLLPHEGYVVNRLAYRQAPPKAEDWVWISRSPRRESGLAQILALPGEEAEWSDGALSINGRPCSWTPPRGLALPAKLRWVVPPGQVLAASPRASASDAPSRTEPRSGFDPGLNPVGLFLTETNRIEGRVWARIHPVWRRALVD